MKVLKPIKIGPSQLLYSSGFGAADGSPAAWAAGTAYTTGQRVRVDALGSVFEAVAGSTGVTPTLTMTTPWVRVGAMNGWRPFDGVVGNQMTGFNDGAGSLPGHFAYWIQPQSPFQAVAVLNVDAASVSIILNYADGNILTNTIYAVDPTGIIDAWTYCFADVAVRRDFVFEGLDGWIDSSNPTATTLRVIIDNVDQSTPVRVGEIVLGQAFDLGETSADLKMRLVDYSKKEVTAYGESVLIERSYSFDQQFEVAIPKARRSRVQSLVSSLRATACVWFPSETEANQGIALYGWPADFEVTYSTPDIAFANISIKGLI